ncbi:MAG: hypothetical protein E5X43_39660 [Mesorhizobium sp.]|nr:MAG: hypothetical protein E5X43_39660 [Mesorhizobium sp.]
MLDRLNLAGEIDWFRASVDSSSIAAKKGGDTIGPNPTDRGKPGRNAIFWSTGPASLSPSF